MTKEQFERYRFSIETQAKFQGDWYRITEVDFSGWIGMENGYYVKIEEIEDFTNDL